MSLSHSAQGVAASRAQAPHTSMFLRMLVRAAVLRRGRALSALFAMVVAAGVTTAMLNLYVDVQAKLRREFRNYGANIVLVGKDGASLPADALAHVESVLAGRGVVAPFALVVARTSDGQSSRRCWHGFRAGSATRSLVVGERMAFRATTGAGRRARSFCRVAEEPALRSYLSGTHHSPRRLPERFGPALPKTVAFMFRWLISFPGPACSLRRSRSLPAVRRTRYLAIMRQLAQAIPAADVRPVRQIMEGEARVLGKTRATLLAAAALIILTAALCVLSTLMGWVFDRRRDFAIMKALGASDRLLNGFFAAEAAALGASGALIGFVLGIGIAAWIGRVNFHAPVAPRFSVLPFVLAGSIVVTLLSAVLPIWLLRRVQPAVILRGE